MDDFDFNLDFDLDSVKTSHKRQVFKLRNAVDNLSLFELPSKNEEIRMISPAYGFSSCALIMRIAEDRHIDSLFATTLRVGKKEINAICQMMDDGSLDDAEIWLSGLAKENNVNGKDYGYQRYFEDKADEYGIRYRYVKNHSKVILLKCDDDYIVIETSSNLNENPKIEQFCVVNDKNVYDFYMSTFDKIIND